MLSLTLLNISLLAVIAALLAVIVMGVIRRKHDQDRRVQSANLDRKIQEARDQELEWHREKRFLMERQTRETHNRIALLIDSVAPENAQAEPAPVPVEPQAVVPPQPAPAAVVLVVVLMRTGERRSELVGVEDEDEAVG